MDDSPQDATLARLRTLLDAAAPVREVSMFGGRAVMVRDKMLVSVGKDGGLLVRVDADQHAELVVLPGARQAVMGTDRDMGPGWIQVAPDALAGDGLATWLDAALAHNEAVTR